MFKSKSYNVEKVSQKNEKEKEKSSSSSSSSSSGTMTLKKKTKSKVLITKNHQNILKKPHQKMSQVQNGQKIKPIIKPIVSKNNDHLM